MKASLFGADPNWGRVLATVGARCGSQKYDIAPGEDPSPLLTLVLAPLLAAIAVAMELEVEPDTIRQGLATFSGVDRRFQVRGSVNGRRCSTTKWMAAPTEKMTIGFR